MNGYHIHYHMTDGSDGGELGIVPNDFKTIAAAERALRAELRRNPDLRDQFNQGEINLEIEDANHNVVAA